MTIDINLLKERIESYYSQYSGSCSKRPYADQYDSFWKRKVEIELRGGHILDEENRNQTYSRLCDILPKWGVYRGVPGLNWREYLKEALERISNAYSEVRGWSLLELNELPEKSLELIWHELGAVKSYGSKNSCGKYHIIAICKPLMFIWGQTLPFDSINRGNIPKEYETPDWYLWTFDQWKVSMTKFQEELKKNADVIKLIKEESTIRYGTNSIIPYGRFLDYYYF